MTVQTAKTVKTSLYRLTDIGDLGDAFVPEVLRPKSWYERADVVVGGHQAILVSGAPTSPSKWAPYVRRLTAQDVSFTNSTPRAALVLLDQDGDDGDAWALTWGMGHLLINTDKIEFGFGPGVIARSAVSGEIKSVTKTVLDHRARVDRSTLPVGSVIQDFGLDGFGEVVSRLEAKARIPGLKAGDGIIVLSAADSLKIPLAVDPTDLISDLAVLTALRTQPVVRGLESIEQLVALKPRDALIPDLEARLIARLRGKSDDAIALSWPHEQLEIYGPALSCKVTGIGDRIRRVSESIPGIAEVLSWFAGLTPDEAEHRLQAISLQLFSEPEPTRASAVSAAVSLRRWIALEVRKESSRFCFHLGKWYAWTTAIYRGLMSECAPSWTQRSMSDCPPGLREKMKATTTFGPPALWTVFRSTASSSPRRCIVAALSHVTSISILATSPASSEVEAQRISATSSPRRSSPRTRWRVTKVLAKRGLIE